ncbi:MAG: hypothetical protein NTZ35_01555 [Ignavibacteriales bacterium]|nr:hypothetical protein [Ignavibacteriales bacterium]
MRWKMLLLVSLFFSACGGYSEGVLQKAEKGYLKFVGNVQNVTVVIDGGDAISLEAKNQVYQVKPGRHEVKAMRDGQMILNRILVVDNQTTVEVEIP